MTERCRARRADPHRRRPSLRRRAALLFLAASLSGCSPRYVARAAWEEARFLWRRQPIEALLRRSDLDSHRRAKLQIVLQARGFAEGSLGLRVGGSFASMSEVTDEALVHVLSAARRDRLEPKTWWFPIVGQVPYKGYFSKERAEAAAQALEREGYDTYVRPAVAFSTLGWFDDPLPSTLLGRNPVLLADVIFHELFHATVFVPGDMTFNESAASFVGRRAAIEFFCSPPARVDEDCDLAVANWEDTLVVSRFLASAIAGLEEFYATSPDAKALEAGRQKAFERIRRRFGALELRGASYRGFVAAPMNNATLLHDLVYLTDLDLFEELYRQRGGVRAVIEALRDGLGRSGKPFQALQNLLDRPPLDFARLESRCTSGSPACGRQAAGPKMR